MRVLFGIAKEYPHPNPLPEYGSTELAEVRATGPKGFTLIELMVVLSIILIVVAIAVPVWSTLSGNNSIATAQNQVAAMLGNARADALYNRQMTGVFFFLDPTSGQTAMAEVQADLYYNPTSKSYVTSYTPAAASPGDNTNAAQNGPVTVLEMANYLPGYPTPPATPLAGTDPYVYYRDVLLLPAGVGVALSNNSNPYAAATVPGLDRYLRCGVIMFDATGNLTTIPYGVPYLRQTPYIYNNGIITNPTELNHLGIRLGLIKGTGDLVSNFTPTAVGAPVPPYPLISQVGLLLYDHNTYLNQITTNSSSPGDHFTDADIQCDQPVNSVAPKYLDKVDEENWLDQNGVAFLVSPFNGSLIKAR